MRYAEEAIRNFLQSNFMDPAQIDPDAVAADFKDEMEKGLAGEKSSLAMFPTYIRPQCALPESRRVVVLDAGGTNLRAASVIFSGGKPVIEDLSFYPMPGSRGEVTRGEFYSALADCLEPLADKSDRIGFCFSYPADISPGRDGRLTALSKEVRVTGLVGDYIGDGLKKALERRGHPGKTVVMLNDTVATMLGGAAVNANRVFEGCIGFILGTGTNLCYTEDSSRIKKLRSPFFGPMLINTESGGFSRLPRGRVDRAFDATTARPGEQLLEKMTSGAYQGGLFRELFFSALREGIFSRRPEGGFELPEITSKDLDYFLFFPYSGDTLLERSFAALGFEVAESDRKLIYCLIDAVIGRAALLAAATFAAVMKKTGVGENPLKPVLIVADGSTFYKSKLFRDRLNFYVRQYLNGKKGLYCEFAKAENANLIGAAAAGLQI